MHKDTRRRTVRIPTAIWKDHDWTQLTASAQLLALAGMTLRTTGPCTDARIARKTGWSSEFIARTRPEVEASKYSYVLVGRMPRRRMPIAVRDIVFARDGGQCLRCSSRERLTVDHIYPVSLGGDDELNNLQTLCHSCNCKKGVSI